MTFSDISFLSSRATGIASEEYQGTYIAKTNTGEYDKGLVEEILIQISKTFTWIFRRRINSLTTCPYQIRLCIL